ncbi:YitT family protein [Neobacillus sp. Marseille-QA0830]
MLKKLAVIGFGSAMIGIGINGFILPYHLISGGFFGVSLLLNYLFGYKAGITFILLNIPVYLFAYKSDREYFYNGVIGAVCSGFMIELLLPISGTVHLPISSSIMIGATAIGIGAGIMLRNHISPGGIDLLSLLISKWSHLNVGIVAFSIDTVIILTGLFLIGDPKLLFSLLIVSIIGLLISIITSFGNPKSPLIKS